MPARVVVTGVGTLSPEGRGVGAFWDSLVRPVDEPVRSHLEGFDHRPWMTAKEIRRSAAFTRHAIVAADEAVAHAGAPALDPMRTGVVLSTVYGAPEALEAQQRVCAEAGPGQVLPVLGALASESAPASALCLRYGIRGPSKVVVGACAGGAFAIGDGADLIAAGRCDVVLAGATQGPMTPSIVASYDNLHVLARDGWSRPFDRRRSGFVFAEGAAVLVLESAEHARQRGARPLAELVGWANTNDAEDMFKPSGTGAVECMRAALASAGLEANDIVHVNAHGTGTPVNDRLEAEAIGVVFGRPGPSVTSIKRVTGHMAGASGAFEAVSVVLAMQEGVLPPCGIDVEPDPEITCDLVTGGPRPWEPGPTLSNSFGLGGHNGSLVFVPVG